MQRKIPNKDLFSYTKFIQSHHTSRFKLSNLVINGNFPYPIKPSEYLIPKDLDLQQIFTNMLKSSDVFYKTYASKIPLLININNNNNTRKLLLKYMLKFFEYHNINKKIFFKSILLLDILIFENKKNRLLSLEEIALGALILSIKFNYIENKMFSMKKFQSFFGENAYSLNDLLSIERRALYVLNYNLGYFTPMCFMEFLLLNGILFNTDYLEKREYDEIYSRVEEVLEQLMIESNCYLKYKFFHVACAVVAYCRENLKLEKWPKMLAKDFNLDFSLFQNEYEFFFGKKNKCNRTVNNSRLKDKFVKDNNNIVLIDFNNLNKNINLSNKKSLLNTFFRDSNNIINMNINNLSFNNHFCQKTDKNDKNENDKNNNKNKNINSKLINLRNSTIYKKYYNTYESYKKYLSSEKYTNNPINEKNINNKINIDNDKQEKMEVKNIFDKKNFKYPNKNEKNELLLSNNNVYIKNDKTSEKIYKFKYKRKYYINKNKNNDKEKNDISINNWNTQTNQNDIVLNINNIDIQETQPKISAKKEYNINNITNKEGEFKNNIQEITNTTRKSEILGIRESYKMKKKFIKNEDESKNNEQFNKKTSRLNSNNTKKHRGDNRLKYNDLIKYKLSMCDSVRTNNYFYTKRIKNDINQ